MFFFGLVSGLVFSGLYYWGMAALGMFDQFPAAGFGAIVIKIVAAILLFRVPRWRSFGIGLLVSMPLAVLIFVCACFGVFAFHL